ncbi:MAG: type II toxin-antitoxin system VapC family toxin [Anaerolineae bacterium]|nr:type II toxin-antitoxin system VapC family toxin [Anaerolineae bacterium]
MQIAIDTSFLIGLLDPQDIWHDPAVAVKGALQALEAEVVVFDCVLSEALSTLARRIHEQRRLADLNRLLDHVLVAYPADDIMWALPDVPALYVEIVALMRASGGELNFNDALIALSCRYRDIPLIASFDRDFDRVDWLKRVASPGDLV